MVFFMLLLSTTDHFLMFFFFQRILSGIAPECQTAWIQIGPDSDGPDLGPNRLQRSSTGGHNSPPVRSENDDAAKHKLHFVSEKAESEVRTSYNGTSKAK